MDAGLVIAVFLALGFAVTNGLHDASNAIATLVATRAARPSQAIVMATFFNLLGPLAVRRSRRRHDRGNRHGLALGGDCGDRIGPCGSDRLEPHDLASRIALELGHALVGGLVGAAVVEGGIHAVNWGGMDGLHPVGVFGTLIALGVSPILGFLVALGVIRILRRAARRVTHRWRGGAQAGQWVTSAALSFSHGANDAQKTVGVVAALLLADGRIDSLSAPTWVIVLCSLALTAGTALGGWRIIRTVGRRIYRIHPLEGLSSQSSSAGVILGASFLGAPVSTSQVVASSVVGIGAGRRRLRHVNWYLVREIGLAWLVTLPASAAIAAAFFGVLSVVR